MSFGLLDKEIEKIQQVFETNSKVDKAFVFGSRAKGNYKEGSDIDIAIKGNELNFNDVRSLVGKLDELNLIYDIDLLDYAKIKEPALKEHIDRVGIEFYSRWKDIQLRSISSDISYGYTASASNENVGPKFLRITDITSGRVNWETVPYCKISDKDLKKYKLGVGDIVIARTGATTGYNAIIKKEVEAVYASYLIRFQIDKKKADPNFVGYILQSNNFQDYVDAIAGGSAQPGANAQQFADYEFSLPPIEEQTAIASILSSLDDKIDLLHRQNKTLEQLAETLFRQWFVEEAEASWEVVNIGKFVETNQSSISKNYQFKEIEYLDTSSLTVGLASETQKLSLKDAPSRAKRLVQNNDILISTVRPDQKHYGIINNPIPNLVVSTGFCVITCTKISPYFIYLLLTNDEMTQYLHSIAEGSTSTYPSLKPSDIEKIEFLNPPMEKLREFEILASDYWKKININQTQIRTLTQTRDTLLPKLMSGEVRVEM